MYTTAMTNAPLINVRPRRAAERKSIDALVDDARVEHEDWFFLFDSRSNLHVAGAADFNVVVELISTAPNERLRGYIEGLYVNN